tara:strand:+ start:329 stop:586 length:258 start_codon:yes stop_codon:yes gene_type:complete
MKNETYNGWYNYATWRINLEIFDGYNPINAADLRPAHEIADTLEEQVDEILENNPELALSYARAFVSDVDWQEIAEHLLEDNDNN